MDPVTRFRQIEQELLLQDVPTPELISELERTSQKLSKRADIHLEACTLDILVRSRLTLQASVQEFLYAGSNRDSIEFQHSLKTLDKICEIILNRPNELTYKTHFDQLLLKISESINLISMIQSTDNELKHHLDSPYSFTAGRIQEICGKKIAMDQAFGTEAHPLLRFLKYEASEELEKLAKALADKVDDVAMVVFSLITSDQNLENRLLLLKATNQIIPICVHSPESSEATLFTQRLFEAGVRITSITNVFNHHFAHFEVF